MPEPVAEFFEQLARRGHEPLLEKARGRLRFEVAYGERTEDWVVDVDGGDVAVSQASPDGEADLVVRADDALLGRIVTGRANAMAAVLRGAIEVEGNLDLIMLFQRVFPGPPGSGDERRTAGYARRTP